MTSTGNGSALGPSVGRKERAGRERRAVATKAVGGVGGRGVARAASRPEEQLVMNQMGWEDGAGEGGGMIGVVFGGWEGEAVRCWKGM